MTDEVFAEIEAARARVNAQIAEAELRRSAVDKLAEDVKQLSVSVQSPRGEVQATAQPGGKVTGVRFTEAALSLSADALSRLVTETIARAQHQAAMAAVDRSAQLLGDGSAFVEELRTQANTSFPPPAGGIQLR